MPGGGDAGLGLGLDFHFDFSAVIQAALVGFVLYVAVAAAVRRAASRYFVVDAAYHNHHHAMPTQRYQPPLQQQPTVQGWAAELRSCAQCGVASNTRCSGCKRVRYCSGRCQIMHWRSDHKFKCKQMRLMNPVRKLPCGVEANSTNNEKWKHMNNGCYLPKKSSNKSNREQVNDEDGRSPTPSSVVPTERRKAEKKLKKGGDGVVFHSAVQEMITIKKEMGVGRKQEKESRWMDVKTMKERKVAIEEEKLELLGEGVWVKKMEQEYKIMFMDISGLDETQREYVELMREQILTSRRGAGAFRSGNRTV